MSKEDQRIIVVERDVLFWSSSNNYFDGFRSHKEVNYESIILSNLKIRKRRDAEDDSSYKQLIGYTIIANPELKKVFVYQRSAEENGGKRLQKKLSWGFGRHIEPFDSKNGNPIKESLLRKTNEEVEIIGEVRESKVLGYINDDSTHVGRFYFGIIYVIDTNATEVKPKDSEIVKVQLKTIKELEEICISPNFNVQTWSRIALEPLKEYFN